PAIRVRIATRVCTIVEGQRLTTITAINEHLAATDRLAATSTYRTPIQPAGLEQLARTLRLYRDRDHDRAGRDRVAVARALGGGRRRHRRDDCRRDLAGAPRRPPAPGYHSCIGYVLRPRLGTTAHARGRARDRRADGRVRAYLPRHRFAPSGA